MTGDSRARIGIKTSPQDTDSSVIDATWTRIGEHRVFDSAWLNDHLTNARDPQGGAWYAQGWITPFLLPGGRTDRLPYFVELRGKLLARMAEIGRDPAGFEFAIQVPTGSTVEARRDGLRLALDSVAAGATSIVLSMPTVRGPAGVDSVVRDIALPLRDALE